VGVGEGVGEEKEEKEGEAGAVAGTVAGASAGAVAVAGTVGGVDLIPLYRITDPADFRLLLPLISGLPAAEVEASLPSIIKHLSEEPEALKMVFSRITKARPPPLTKAALLCALHRIDFKKHSLEAKPVLEAISLCMTSKSEYSGEVIKDSLRMMLLDEIPPYALMRTASLAAKSFTEVSRFVLSDVIPALVRRRVWQTAPKLWDGVVHGAKNLASAGAKNAEHTLRALLGVPAAQLRAMLKIAPQVKAAMGKLLKTLSKEETEEVITGRWVGLLPIPGIEGKEVGGKEVGGKEGKEGKEGGGAEGEKQAADKLKLVRDIAGTTATATTTAPATATATAAT
jgi:hypothetical protein